MNNRRRLGALVFLSAGLLTAGDINLPTGLVVAPGEWTTLTVSLAHPAPDGGVIVSLTSSDSNILTVNPSLVRIYAGDTMPLRQPQVTGVNFGAASVTAGASGLPLSGDTQTVRVGATLLGPQTFQAQRGIVQSVTLVLSSPAPSNLTLNLSSDNSAIASVPASINVPAGSTGLAVPITGVAAGSTAIHIGAPPAIAQKDLQVTVVTPAGITVPNNLIIPLGTTAPWPVTLGTPAGPSGVTVKLSSSNTARAIIAPASVFVAPGQTSPASQPQVTAVDLGGATITASATGYVTATAPTGASATLAFSPTALTITGTSLQKIVLALSASAPWGTGFTAQLTSSNPGVAIVAPSTDFYPDGSAFTSVVVMIQPIAPGTTVLTASAPPFVAPTTATITVLGAGGGGVPSAIAVSGGTSQTANINTPFGAPLAARVTDAGASPLSGIQVQFAVPASGPSGTFAGGVTTAVTNALGVATSATLTANATPGSWAATATVTGVAAAASFSLTNSSPASGSIVLPTNAAVSPGQSIAFPISLSVPAGPSGATIALSSGDTSKATVSPATVSVAPGSTVPLLQPTVTGVNFGNPSIIASAVGYATGSQTVKVGAALSFQPAILSLQGATPQSLNLTLSSNAPAAGVTVNLTSNNPAVASVPGSVTIPAGASSIPVTVTGVAAGSATITAHTAAPNVVDATASVTVSLGSDITLASGLSVGPGDWSPMAVTLAKPAPDGGVLVSLASSDTSVATINPSLVRINAGTTMPSRQPQVNGVSFGAASITASAFSLTGDTQTVRVGASLVGPPSYQAQRGATQNLILALTSAAPAALTLNLTSDNPSVAGVPATLNVNAGAGAVAIPVTGVALGSTTIHIGAPPAILVKDIAVTVTAPAGITLPSGLVVPLGATAPLTITLGTPAGPSGVVVALSSTDITRMTVAPNSVFVAPGQTSPSAQPQVTAVDLGGATINASAAGYIPASTNIGVSATLTFTPTSLTVSGTALQRVVLALSASAPWDTGVTAQLTSSNPNVAIVPQSINFFPDGSAFTSVVVLFQPVGPGTTVITASVPPYIAATTTTITVVP